MRVIGFGLLAAILSCASADAQTQRRYAPVYDEVRFAVRQAADYAPTPILERMSEHLQSGAPDSIATVAANKCALTSTRYWNEIGLWFATNTTDRPRRTAETIVFLSQDMGFRFSKAEESLRKTPVRLFLEPGEEVHRRTESAAANIRQRAEWLAFYDSLLAETTSLHEQDKSEVTPAFTVSVYIRARCDIVRANDKALRAALVDGLISASDWSPATAASVVALARDSADPELIELTLRVAGARMTDAQRDSLRPTQP